MLEDCNSAIWLLTSSINLCISELKPVVPITSGVFVFWANLIFDKLESGVVKSITTSEFEKMNLSTYLA